MYLYQIVRLTVIAALAAFGALPVCGRLAGMPATADAQTASDWPMYGFDIAHDGYNPGETILSPTSVQTLVTKWTFSMRGKGDKTTYLGQPLLAAQVPVGHATKDLLLIGSNKGTMYALDANSANAAGSVVWQHALPAAMTCSATLAPPRILATAAIERSAPGGGGTVYVASQGLVFAFDLATGATAAGWPSAGLPIPNLASQVTDGQVHSGLTLLNGQLYVTTSSGCGDQPPYHGQISLIDTASASVVGQWFALSGSSTPPSVNGGGIWGVGGVSIDPTPGTGGVYATTGNPLPDPGSATTPPAPYGEAIVQLSPDLSQLAAYDQPQPWTGDNDFAMTPVLFQPAICPGLMVAAGKKTGAFAIYRAGLTGRQVLQLKPANSQVPLIGAAAFDAGTQFLLVANPGANAAYPRGLIALRADANCRFGLAWHTADDLNGEPIVSQDTFLSAPTAANGVAYFGVGHAGKGAVAPFAPYRVYAVAETGATPGQVLWQSSDIEGPVGTAPIIVNGRLYVVSLDAEVHAYGLP